ncbi:MAG: hypothetical protein R3F14_24765 [Polyangiaceae bacterium]
MDALGGAAKAAAKKPATSCKNPKKSCVCEAPPTQNPTITSVRPVVDGGCGKYEWRVFYNLDKPTCKGGWIIQEVTFVIKAGPAGKPLKNMLNLHYWEAWKVSPGKTIPDSRATYGYDDMFAVLVSFPGTYGVTEEHGKVRFFEDLTLPSDFKPNNPKTPAAGVLHATTKKPSFWNGRGSYHDLVDSWNCTAGHNHATIETVPR